MKTKEETRQKECPYCGGTFLIEIMRYGVGVGNGGTKLPSPDRSIYECAKCGKRFEV